MFDHAQLIRMCEEKGWKVELTGGGHNKLVSPEGKVVFASNSPSDNRAARNLAKDLRKAGLDIRGEADPVKRDGMMTSFVKDFMRNHPDKLYSSADLLAVLRSKYPKGAEGNISSMMSNWTKKGIVERPDRGFYRWVGDRPPAQKSVPKPVAPALLVLPTSEVSSPTGNVDVDADLAALDAALAALGHIEAVVRKHRDVFAQLAKLKSLLGG